MTTAGSPPSGKLEIPTRSNLSRHRIGRRTLLSRRAFPRRLLIVKFGGSSLATAGRIASAVEAVAEEYARGTRLVVVVSAVGRTTDQLLELTNRQGMIVNTDKDDILAMGERTSARIFAATLKAREIQSRHFDPTDNDWPIITDENFSNANPLREPSTRRIRRYVRPLLAEGVVPVIGGFIGRTQDGRVSTLGRGGSDTTALLLAQALGADEVILITSSPGIMTGDPKVLSRPKVLTRIDMRSLVGLADSGTKFIHRKALRFKVPNINVRVIPYKSGNLQSNGTIVTGGPESDLEVRVHNPDKVASVTLVGKRMSGSPDATRRIMKIAGSHFLGSSQDRDSIILYIGESPSTRKIIERLHETVVRQPNGVAVAVRRGLAQVTVKGAGLEDTPGLIARIGEILRANRVNIYGILTITSSIIVFVEWKLRRLATRLIRKSLEPN